MLEVSKGAGGRGGGEYQQLFPVEKAVKQLWDLNILWDLEIIKIVHHFCMKRLDIKFMSHPLPFQTFQKFKKMNGRNNSHHFLAILF